MDEKKSSPGETGTAAPANAAATATAATSTSQTGVAVNLGFISSISGLLYALEWLFGMITWAIMAAVKPRVAWISFVLFTGVTSWLLTMILIAIFVTGLHAGKLSGLPWPVVELGHHSLWSFFYLVSASLMGARGRTDDVTAACVLGFFVTCCHITHALLSLKAWRGGFPWQ